VTGMLALARRYTYSLKIFRRALAAALSDEKEMFILYFGAFASVIRWTLRPSAYTTAHFSASHRPLLGFKWVSDDDGRVTCSGCREGHPMELMRFARGMLRWDPGSAHSEVLALIDRGDLKDTPENRARWADIPEGCMVAWSTPAHPDLDRMALPTITVIDSEGQYRTTGMSHIIELWDDQFEEFSSWLEDFMPEWEISRSGASMSATYDPQHDVMDGINPYLFVNRYNQPGVTPHPQLELIVREEDEY
jgi:hypothetical protein